MRREGGAFQLRLTFSNSYPNTPPRARFTSEIFHPNVYTDGTLCLDIIQDKWSPCLSISSLLMSVQSLLADPNCSSPANGAAAVMYSEHRNEYNKKVRRLAQKTLECEF